jgi:hypothetical protein
MAGLSYHPEAKNEIREAAAFYQGRRHGLGEDANVVITAVAHTKRKPGYWKQRLSGD